MYLEEPLNLRVKWGDHAKKLARELLGRGYSVRGFGAPPGLIPRSGEDAQPEPGSKREHRAYFGKLARFDPDVLIAYDALSPAAMRGARMARKLGASLVLVEAALPWGGNPFERALWRVGEALWGRYVRRTASAVVALDPFARESALREGFAPEIVRVIPQGVDTSHFRPGLTSTLVSRHRIRGRILLYVGRLAPNRGLEVLIKAFARTVGQRTDWSLVLAGEGSARSSLRALAERLGVAGRVHWLARPRVEELPGLMGASTLLAVPARDASVLGKQIGRAMASGLPVIASDLQRFRGLVDSPQTGLLVEPGDLEAWTEAIRWAAGSPMARRRWADSARRVALEELDWSTITARFEEIFALARARVDAKLENKGDAPADLSPGKAS